MSVRRRDLDDLILDLHRRASNAAEYARRHESAGNSIADALCHGKAKAYAHAAEMVEALIARLGVQS